MQSAALAQMELSVGAGWSTFRGGKVGETTVLVFPQTVLLDVTMNNGFRAGARVTINAWEHFGHEVNYAYQRNSLRYAVSPKDPASRQTTATTSGEGFGIQSRCKRHSFPPWLSGWPALLRA
jgi:hypothetical protein